MRFKFKLKMYSVLSLALIAMLANVTYAQQRIVFNDVVYITIDNNANLVIDNSNSNAISFSTIGGGIISESEYDIVKWNIDNATVSSSYLLPWVNSNLYYMPFTMVINTAGVGNGSFNFSTHANNGVVNWDNFDYRPSDVTNMIGMNGAVNNSQYVIDRFWKVHAVGYSTKPAVTLTFNYDDSERSTVGNNIIQGTMVAQQYNTATNAWVYPGVGLDNTSQVSNATVVPSTFNMSWTLTESAHQLPIELLSFDATLTKEFVVDLEWVTASELNNDYFTIEKSRDALNWSVLKVVNGAGNSSQTINYTDLDPDPIRGISYYRLKQTDFDGSYSYSSIRVIDNSVFDLSLYPNPFSNGNLYLNISSTKDQILEMLISDNSGKIVFKVNIEVLKKQNTYSIQLPELASGAYWVSLSNGNELLGQKQLNINN